MITGIIRVTNRWFDSPAAVHFVLQWDGPWQPASLLRTLDPRAVDYVRGADECLRDLIDVAESIWLIPHKEILISILDKEWGADRSPSNLSLLKRYDQLWDKVVFDELKKIIPGFNEQAFRLLKAARIISS